MSRRLLWLALATAAACRSAPVVDGTELRCNGDACPDGLRCIEGMCLVNSPPEVDPLGTRIVAPGRPFTVTAEATDADGDPVTFSWSQIDGWDPLESTCRHASLSIL